MGFLNLLFNSVDDVIVSCMLSNDLMGEVCHFSCGNGNGRRVAALF